MSDVILDGEATRLGPAGRSRYHVFDVLWLDGRDLTGLPLDERRALLAALPLRRRSRASQPLDDPDPGSALPRRLGRRDRQAARLAYEHRRSPHWLKMKCEVRRSWWSAGSPIRRARVSGWARCSSATSRATTSCSPARSAPGSTRSCCSTARAARRPRDRRAAVHEGRGACRGCGAHWVRPEVVVQVAFIEWTVHGKLRHPRLLGLRFDKAARDVVRERRDHASGEGAVPRRRHHQRRAGRVLRGDRAGHGAAHPPAARDDGAVSRGIGRKGFFQKDVSKGFPEWLERVEVPKKGGVVHHPLVTDTRSLLWMVNQNSITPHVWISRVP